MHSSERVGPPWSVLKAVLGRLGVVLRGSWECVRSVLRRFGMLTGRREGVLRAIFILDAILHRFLYEVVSEIRSPKS